MTDGEMAYLILVVIFVAMFFVCGELEKACCSAAHRLKIPESIAGATLLAPGHLLTPGALASIAAHGVDRVSAHRLPRVAVLATGDEVVAPEQKPRPGQIRDTNTGFLLAAAVLTAVILPSLPDSFWERMATIRTPEEQDRSVQGRFHFWKM